MRLLLLAFVLVAAVPFAVAKKPPPGPRVLIVSDAMSASEDLLPTPERPVYYIVLGAIERDLGDSIAGEAMPDPDEVRAELVKVLATQGFIQTQNGKIYSGGASPAPGVRRAVLRSGRPNRRSIRLNANRARLAATNQSPCRT